MHMSQEEAYEGYNIDAVHMAISLVDHSLMSEGFGTGHKLSVMDANADASSLIRQFGSMYLHHGDLQMTLEYYAQAAMAVGGGQRVWSGRSNVDQRRQRNLMLKQLLTEILLREGGIYKYSPDVGEFSHLKCHTLVYTSVQERDQVMEQETILRELEALLLIHKLARLGNHLNASKEAAKLPLLHLDPRLSDTTPDEFQRSSSYFQTCFPDLLKVVLTCLDNVADPNGSIQEMRSKIAGFLASNTHQNWPRDLYEKVPRSF